MVLYLGSDAAHQALMTITALLTCESIQISEWESIINNTLPEIIGTLSLYSSIDIPQDLGEMLRVLSDKLP